MRIAKKIPNEVFLLGLAGFFCCIAGLAPFVIVMFVRHTMIRLIADRARWVCCYLWLVVGVAPVSVQAAETILPVEPSGFTTAVPVAPSGFTDRSADTSLDSGIGAILLDGLTLGTTFSSIYNSNVAPTQNTGSTTAKDDYILGFGGNLNYQSKASALTFGGNYRGNYNQYFNHSDYSGYTQGGGLLATYEGGRFTATATARMSVDRGSNSNYSSAFVQQTSVNTGLTARYRLSPKTSLAGDCSQSSTSASTGNYSSTSSYNLGASALWKYSALTELGPGVRYTYRTGSRQSGRTSIGPTATLNYKLSKKVTMNSRVGMDFASYDNGAAADPTFSASLGLNYQASRLWGMNFSLYRDTQADANTAGAFTDSTSLRLGYHRKIRQAIWNIGTTYQTSSSSIPGSTASNAPSRTALTMDTSLGMPLFSNTTYGSVFLQYNDQNNGPTNSYDSIQIGFSLSRNF